MQHELLWTHVTITIPLSTDTWLEQTEGFVCKRSIEGVSIHGKHNLLIVWVCIHYMCVCMRYVVRMHAYGCLGGFWGLAFKLWAFSHMLTFPPWSVCMLSLHCSLCFLVLFGTPPSPYVSLDRLQSPPVTLKKSTPCQIMNGLTADVHVHSL